MSLTELEQAVLQFMADGPEPTWIFLAEMPELDGDRVRLERILIDFEARGLATRTRETSGQPGPNALDAEDWWLPTPSGQALVRD